MLRREGYLLADNVQAMMCEFSIMLRREGYLLADNVQAMMGEFSVRLESRALACTKSANLHDIGFLKKAIDTVI
jgi:hypothetical protein